ncbi:hypothetical protein Droror1_Dr00002365 [Drosera rotundifolia]
MKNSLGLFNAPTKTSLNSSLRMCCSSASLQSSFTAAPFIIRLCPALSSPHPLRTQVPPHSQFHNPATPFLPHRLHTSLPLFFSSAPCLTEPCFPLNSPRVEAASGFGSG